jgi:hypothetical protein
VGLGTVCVGQRGIHSVWRLKSKSLTLRSTEGSQRKHGVKQEMGAHRGNVNFARLRTNIGEEMDDE